MTAGALRTFAELPQGSVELAESVEMLRLVEHGLRVRLLRTRDSGPDVDTPSDLDPRPPIPHPVQRAHLNGSAAHRTVRRGRYS
jgi:CMP-2-keto-3-deoxyoctulosonic acid synthetase